MDVAASGECDVGMKWAKFRFQAALKRRFLDALVKLKQMRMPGANTDPDNFGMSFGWKFSEASNRKEKRPKLNRAQLFAQAKLDLLRHTIEKSESEMHLIPIDPAHAATMWIKIDERPACRIWQVDGNKETFAHCKISRSWCTFFSIENKAHARS